MGKELEGEKAGQKGIGREGVRRKQPKAKTKGGNQGDGRRQQTERCVSGTGACS